VLEQELNRVIVSVLSCYVPGRFFHIACAECISRIGSERILPRTLIERTPMDTIEFLLKHLANNNGRSAFGESHILDFIPRQASSTRTRFKGGLAPGPMTICSLPTTGTMRSLHARGEFWIHTSFQPLAEPAPPPKVPVPFDFCTLTVMNSSARGSREI